MYSRGKPIVVLLSVLCMVDLSATCAQAEARRKPAAATTITGSASASITRTSNGFSGAASASTATSSTNNTRPVVRRTQADVARSRAKKQRLNRFIRSQVPELREVDALLNLQGRRQRRAR